MSFLLLFWLGTLWAERARDLGIPLDGVPGPLNAITDVPGIQVGHATLIEGKNIRTGVTAIFPRGKKSVEPVFAGWSPLNGNGEMTGTHWVEESGLLDGPIVMTNTHSVGTARNAVIQWRLKQKKGDREFLPLIAETWDGFLNDIFGCHFKERDVFTALEGAKSGPVEEGNVGGGTGMVCFEFKGGIGTASRKIIQGKKEYYLGTLVQANFGRRKHLKIVGKPVGKQISDHLVYSKETGSILVIFATDAPFLPHQLKRIARRAPLGLGRLGAIAGNGSGDLFLAFSTAKQLSISRVANEEMDPFFEAAVEGVEEAVLNAMVAAKTMLGVGNHKVIEIPHDKIRALFLNK